MGERRTSRLHPRKRRLEAEHASEVDAMAKGFSTLAGGTVIDPNCRARRVGENLEEQVRRLDRSSPADWIRFALRGAGPVGLPVRELVQRVPCPLSVTQSELEQVLRSREALKLGRETLVGEDAFGRISVRAREALARFHREKPEQAGIKRDALRDMVVGEAAAPLFDAIHRKLVKEGVWQIEGDILSEPDHTPSSASGVSDLADSVMASLANKPAAPPGLKELAAELEVEPALLKRAVDLLVSGGRAQLLDGEYLYAAPFLEKMASDVREFLTRNDKLLVTDLKRIVGATRKHALPLARWLDNAGITLRRGDHRVLRSKS
jgi:selenocysteine-specific elongation factor